MILDVPYQSQLPLETTEKRRWCGLASLWMVLSYFLKEKSPTLKDIFEKYGQNFEAGGFQHKDLLNAAREFGLRGFRKSWWAEPGVQTLLQKFKDEGAGEKDINDWTQTNVEEGVYTITSFIHQEIPVIVSVTPEFSPSETSHLVVVIGEGNDKFTIHDPYKRGPLYEISKEDFQKVWLRQAIVVKPKS